VNIEFMHSQYDVNQYNQRQFEETGGIDDDFPGVFRKPWNDDEIYALASDYFGKECRSQDAPVLEYYHYLDRQWKPFRGTDDPEVTGLYRGKGQPSMPLRLPEEFDDEVDEHPTVHEVVVDGPIPPQRPHEHRPAVSVPGVLDSLVQYLREHNYERYSPTELARRSLDPEQPWDDIIATKQWLIQRAEQDVDLADFLLSRPGALHHLTQCLHWDRVWETSTVHQDL
jgi:hypothetical protein